MLTCYTKNADAKQYDDHMMVSPELNTANNDQDFLQKAVTGDETWCCMHDPQSIELSMRKSPSPTAMNS
jgi:hypothetical protein